MQTKRSGGCAKCGRKSTSKYSMVTSKLFIVPSGKQIAFFVGRETEVSEQDGEFLLNYKYTDQQGNTQSVFTKVE